jgi:hypothetical protein
MNRWIFNNKLEYTYAIDLLIIKLTWDFDQQTSLQVYRAGPFVDASESFGPQNLGTSLRMRKRK